METFGGLDSLVKVKNNDACKKQLVAENNGKLIVLTWLHLIQGTIEVELIQQLKKIYLHWFRLNGVILVFKSTLDLYSYFEIDKKILLKNVVQLAKEKTIGLEELF